MEDNLKRKIKLLIRIKISNIILIVLFIFLAYISLTAPVHRMGDTSTYYMQTQSIANDFDIQYEQKDLQRTLENKFDDLPAGLFLIKNAYGNYFYGKEYSYALFSAPFYKILGNNGILLFNSLMFFSMIYMGYLFLKRKNSDVVALIFSILYFFASIAFLYILWIHAEIFNMFIITLGFFLWYRYTEINSQTEDDTGKTSQRQNNLLFTAAFVFGLAAYAKIPNVFLFIPLLGWELYNRRYRTLLFCVSSFLLPLIILYGFFYFTTGEISPYGGDRLYYVSQFPFMKGYNTEVELGTKWVTYGDNSSFFYNMIKSKFEKIEITVLFYDIFYFIFGRFIGIAWYYMPAIIALFLMLKSGLEYYDLGLKAILYSKHNIKYLLIVFALILNILFYIVNSPTNFFGGMHTVGNRYFYVYPVFLFIVDKIKFDKKLILFFIFALIFTLPININPEENSIQPFMHTTKIPYSVLPLEYPLFLNLPFWGYSYTSSGINYYILDDRMEMITPQDRKMFYINGPEETGLLINSSKKLHDIKLNVFSFVENNIIEIKIGDDKKQMILNKSKNLTLIFLIPNSTFENEKYVLYKSLFETNGPILIDMNESNEIIDIKKIIFLNGWYELENWNNVPSRWMENSGIIKIYSSEEKSDIITFAVTPFYKPREFQIYHNDRLLTKQIIPSRKEMTQKVILEEGDNTIQFYTPDGCQRPIDIPELNLADSRCLSFALQNITFQNFTQNI